MISFIVIGYNEEQKLKLCLQSIYKSIQYNNIDSYEIIYVDSKSSDKSIQIVKEFEGIKVFIILGQCNAAIGRNVGATEAKGSILFFIDADMEICESFLATVLDQNFNLKYDLVTGRVIDYVNGVENKHRLEDDEFLSGGIFLIRKEIWESAKGMNTKYKTGENADLGLRLVKKGFPFVRLNDIITKHHTIPYLSRSRIWKMIWDGSMYYSRCVLYRDHIFDKHMYLFLWKNDKTFILLCLLIVGGFLFPSLIGWFLALYTLVIAIRSSKQIKYLSTIELCIYFIVFDFLNLFYLFFLFPKKYNVKYQKVETQRISQS
jgi:glycosyltransferase involved in cell wall biosynthesis